MNYFKNALGHLKILRRFSKEGIFRLNTAEFKSLYNSGYFNKNFENTPV